MSIDTLSCRKYAGGLERFFQIPPGKNTAFLPRRDKAMAPTAGDTLSPAQQRRIKQLVASLTAPKTKAAVRPTTANKAATKPMVLKPGWRMVVPAECGGTVANHHFQMIRRG